METNAYMFFARKSRKQPTAHLQKDGGLIKIIVGELFVKMLRWFESSQLTDFCVKVAESSGYNRGQLG